VRAHDRSHASAPADCCAGAAPAGVGDFKAGLDEAGLARTLTEAELAFVVAGMEVRKRSLKFTGLTHNFPADPAV
jgi:hypothetical protein